MFDLYLFAKTIDGKSKNLRKVFNISLTDIDHEYNYRSSHIFMKNKSVPIHDFMNVVEKLHITECSIAVSRR